MKITSGKVVSIEFQIADANGAVLVPNDEDGGWTFLVGSGEIPPGLETALEGKEAGESLQVTLTPENGYGSRDEALVTTIAKSELGDEEEELSIGDQLEKETDDGYEIVTVVAMTPDSITVDGNHEFAGKTVVFDVKIIEVRDATPEELEHGHVHDGECEDEFFEEEEWEEDEEWDVEGDDEEDDTEDEDDGEEAAKDGKSN